jgi:hypothetical protein
VLDKGRRSRGTALTEEQQYVFRQRTRTDAARAEVLESFDVKSRKSIDRWRNGGPVTHAVHKYLCKWLSQPWTPGEPITVRLPDLPVSSVASTPQGAGLATEQQVQSADLLLDKSFRSGSLSPEEIIARALKFAAHGHPSAGFNLLLADFDWGAKDLDQSMALLPTVIYFGYRYMAPREFIAAMRRVVLPKLVQSKPGPKCEDWIKALCIFQIGCALNERGKEEGGTANELFAHEKVRSIINSGRDYPWPRQQLIRNEAIYWSLHGDDPDQTIELAKKANELSRGINDDRAIATIHYVAYLKKQEFGMAWGSMESTYKRLRPILLSAANGDWKETDNLWSVFSGVYTGSFAKSISGTKYPQSELSEDLAAMRWCIKKYGHIQLEDTSLIAPASRIPDGLKELQRRCARIWYDANQLDCLAAFVKALDFI